MLLLSQHVHLLQWLLRCRKENPSIGNERQLCKGFAQLLHWSSFLAHFSPQWSGKSCNCKQLRHFWAYDPPTTALLFFPFTLEFCLAVLTKLGNKNVVVPRRTLSTEQVLMIQCLGPTTNQDMTFWVHSSHSLGEASSICTWNHGSNPNLFASIDAHSCTCKRFLATFAPKFSLCSLACCQKDFLRDLFLKPEARVHWIKDGTHLFFKIFKSVIHSCRSNWQKFAAQLTSGRIQQNHQAERQINLRDFWKVACVNEDARVWIGLGLHFCILKSNHKSFDVACVQCEDYSQQQVAFVCICVCASDVNGAWVKQSRVSCAWFHAKRSAGNPVVVAVVAVRLLLESSGC